jgi:hypothetical protein
MPWELGIEVDLIFKCTLSIRFYVFTIKYFEQEIVFIDIIISLTDFLEEF